MTKRKTEKVTETKSHSFENVLGVTPNSTEITRIRVTSDPVAHEDYDAKDVEIDEDIVDIQDKAIELYEYIFDEIEDSEASKRARLVEVAGQLLNTALSASEKRKSLKQHKDTLKQKDRAIAGKSGKTTKNYAFIGTHGDVMKFFESEDSVGEDRLDPNDPSVIDSDDV